MTRRIAAKYISTTSETPIRNGILTLNEDGIITDISADVTADQLKGIEYYDGILSPGFINTHCHLELSYMKDVIPKGTGLVGFVKRIMETKFSFPEDVQRQAIAEADKVMWDSGVQAVGDISNTTVSFDTKVKSQIKYVTFLEIFNVLMGANYRDVLDSGAKLLTEAQKLHLEAYLTLHATYSVSAQLFKEYANTKGTDCVSIHYKESADDDLLFHKKGKFFELFSSKGLDLDFLDEISSTDRIINNIPSDRRMLLIHNSNITQQDIDAMTAHYKNLSLALCPKSNLYIEQKLPPVDLMMSNNLNLTIGTDSLSSNTSLSMIDEMKTLVFQKQVPESEVIKWATINGAKALELAKMGELKVGKCPGVVLIDNIKEDMSFTESTISRRLQ